MMSLEFSVTLQILIPVLSFLTFCTGLKCYSCGTEPSHETTPPNMDNTDVSSHSGSCHDLETKIVYPLRQYIVTCGGDDTYYEESTTNEFNPKPLCVKLVTRSKHTGQFYTQRSCSYAMTRVGKKHELSCGPTMMSAEDMHQAASPAGSPFVNNGQFNISNFEHICFCDTDYCNESDRSLHNRQKNIIVIGMFILLLLYQFLC